MFTVISILSILGGIILYRNASLMSAVSIMFLYSAGLSLAGATYLIAIGMVVAGIVGLFSRNGRRKTCIIIATVMYMLPALISIFVGFEELTLWASLCLVIGAVYILWTIIMKHE